MSEKTATTDKTTESSKSDRDVSQHAERTERVEEPLAGFASIQRKIGNHAVQGLFKSGAIQAKLRIGTPNDKYEQEADRVAEQVMRMPEESAVSFQRSAVGKRNESIQMKPG